MSGHVFILKLFFFIHFLQIKVQMEMLQMDLEDNETAMNAFDSQVEELKGTRDTLNSQLAQKQLQISDMEAKLEECKAQVKFLLMKIHCQVNESYR